MNLFLYGGGGESQVNPLLQILTDPAGFYSAHELLLAQIGVSGLLALSIFVTLFSGQLSLAGVGFMAIGAYTTVILSLHAHTPLFFNMLVGSLLAGLTGFLIGLPVLRLRGVFLAIATIGFGEALRFGVILNLPITGQGQGLKNPDADPLGGLLPIWIALLALGYVVWRLTRSKPGQAWSAIREDEQAAASNAINVPVYKMMAFVLSAIIAGFAGALESHINFFVDPTSYGVDRSVQVLTYAVVGGVSNVVGPIAGAIVLTVLPELIRQAKDYRDVVNGIILILIIVFRPQGLIGRGGLAVIRPRWLPARRRSSAEPAQP